MEHADIWEVVSFPRKRNDAARKENAGASKDSVGQQQRQVRAYNLYAGPTTLNTKANTTAVKSTNNVKHQLFTTINEERQNPKRDNGLSVSNHADLNPKGNLGSQGLMPNHPLTFPNALTIQITAAAQAKGNHHPPNRDKTMEVASNVY
ncbi:hypothetical protein KY290_005624 [Solanum tuberosum]|uniref:Uncharacterized protein n=1 Tax=Solanum tuberosum TaxID=4113 RepID=A0ABQ7WEP1_SOLTU|nr:hypothetical protein KY290_005624 [Solanum tuberosum]